MSDKQSALDASWRGADQATVNGLGTVSDVVTAIQFGGPGLISDLRLLWQSDPENLALPLAREVLRRHDEYEAIVQDTAVEISELNSELADVKASMGSLMETFDHAETHYHLALAVVEAVRFYVSPESTEAVPAMFDDLVATLARFDSFSGPVQVDAIAGDHIAVSVVPPYKGEGGGEDEIRPRPTLSVVPDQE